jgi:hypothetical protein
MTHEVFRVSNRRVRLSEYRLRRKIFAAYQVAGRLLRVSNSPYRELHAA